MQTAARDVDKLTRWRIFTLDTSTPTCVATASTHSTATTVTDIIADIREILCTIQLRGGTLWVSRRAPFTR
jgi:hypothetical protein